LRFGVSAPWARSSGLRKPFLLDRSKRTSRVAKFALAPQIQRQLIDSTRIGERDEVPAGQHVHVAVKTLARHAALKLQREKTIVRAGDDVNW